MLADLIIRVIQHYGVSASGYDERSAGVFWTGTYDRSSLFLPTDRLLLHRPGPICNEYFLKAHSLDGDDPPKAYHNKPP